MLRYGLLFLIALSPLVAVADEYPFEILAELDVPPGNITVTPDGRIIFSTVQFFETDLRVGELVDGEVVPFPNADWSLGENKPHMHIDAALGIQSDPLGIVWILDNGKRNNVPQKLVAWDTRTDSLYKVITITAPVISDDSFLNDLSVDRTHEKIYLSDTAGDQGALVIVDIKTGYAKRVLEGHVSMIPEDIDLVIDGRPAVNRAEDGSLSRPRVAVNGLALDAKNEWLYYGPFSSTSMYRVRTADLLDPSLTPDELADRVERYSDKPLSDGMGVDWAGNIYITSISENAVGVITPEREYKTLFSSEDQVRWPDGMSYAPNGYMHIVANQLHLTPRMTGGRMEASPPYFIIRFKALAPAVVGR